ncbi:uncharacterized protein BO97DRAFT_428824 [Aspergillus homomorphus CBS 101889]|uniref:BTB domain-containing protein n=1 Tax=Aspergillus homomorphus (strain CBS 101889) TaxID=1450537 RepID=A0A395HKZ2_ASPHC|nr:hypothetical protein BO97DRAFT_428824 [Aspergillus homomorphus CBS 101889]RAL07895.1 hypothetical protein BO97DRAFT_428824 [Aspergillus homomorphus CBS 101889]
MVKKTNMMAQKGGSTEPSKSGAASSIRKTASVDSEAVSSEEEAVCPVPEDIPCEPPYFVTEIVTLRPESIYPIRIHSGLLNAKAPNVNLASLERWANHTLARFVDWAYTGTYKILYGHHDLDDDFSADNIDLSAKMGMHIELILFAEEFKIAELSHEGEKQLKELLDTHFTQFGFDEVCCFINDVCHPALLDLRVGASVCQMLASYVGRYSDVMCKDEGEFESLLRDYPGFAVAVIKHLSKHVAQ